VTRPSAPAALDSFDLGAIDQVSYVVRDLDASLPVYRALFGSFEVRETPPGVAWFRGREGTVRFKLAFGECGGLEIELVEPLEGSSPHVEHLARHGEGLQHLRFPTADLDAKRAEMESAGFVPVFAGAPSPAVKYVYLEYPEVLGSSMLELIQVNNTPEEH
jgi:methylmalonyl-CoA/ethylmalonyl-CoA epimerase